MKKTTEELLELLKKQNDPAAFLESEKDEMLNLTPNAYLNTILMENKRKKSDVIREANLDRTYAYQLFSGVKTNPARNKIIMLCFGLHATSSQAQRVLKLFGVSELYVRNTRDAAILYCLQKGMNLVNTNLLLADMHFDILE